LTITLTVRPYCARLHIVQRERNFDGEIRGIRLVAACLCRRLVSQGRGDEQPYPSFLRPGEAPPDTTAPDIPGVVRGGTKVQLIRDLFHSTEGPIAMPDGSVLFTEQDAGDGQLVKIDKDDKVSVFLTNTNRTIGLAYDTKGV
jgi:hypothetical protein